MLFSRPAPVDLVVLVATAGAVGLASVPLARHLWRTPSGFPAHIPPQAVYTEPSDRFATRWGSASRTER